MLLPYGCTTWRLTENLEKKLDANCTRMLRAILKKSCKQHSKKQQLYGYLPPISKTIQIWRNRHAGHCWRSKDKLISKILSWTSLHRRANLRRLIRTYLQQLCTDTGCSLEDLPEVMNDRAKCRKRVRENCTSNLHDDDRFLSHHHLIILSYHQHGYPWPFLATSPCRSSLPVGPQGYTPYPHRAAVCRFELFTLPLLGHRSTSLMSSSISNNLHFVKNKQLFRL